MSVVGCIYSGKYLSGICLVGEMSVGDVSGRGIVRRWCAWSGKCPSGMCLVGEISVGNVSGWGSVHQGCVWLGKCRSGMCLVREMSVGEVFVGEESVGETSVGDVPENLLRHPSLDPACPPLLKSLLPLPFFLFHPFLKYFRQFPPPSRNLLLP